MVLLDLWKVVGCFHGCRAAFSWWRIGGRYLDLLSWKELTQDRNPERFKAF
jgi:hypothetical protein